MGYIVDMLIKHEKVNLKSEAVELGLVQDMEKKFSSSVSDWSKANKTEEKIKVLVSDAISSVNQARSKSSDVIKAYNNLEKQAKELGLDMPPKAKKLRDDAKSYIKKGGDRIKNLHKMK